jgi:dGTPase
MIEWKNCFSRTRLGEENKVVVDKDDRSEFEIDYDRIVFSSAFRRMQDKTQVIPLPESDFVHTRLTHSLEASCVGRSLGKIVGARMIEKYPEIKGVAKSTDFAAIVSSACLAHDIGNPPFGHSGEDAIREYFLNGTGQRFKEKLNPHQWEDLINFEGNASGFRLLTNLMTGSTGGLKLTYATLAAYTKYPRTSINNATDRKRRSQKKFSIFESEGVTFKKIAERLDLLQIADFCWIRHPLAFLVEAADDICYRIIDFEDGARLGLIPLEVAHAKLRALIDQTKFNEAKLQSIPDPRERTSYLRAKAISAIIYQVTDEFCRREEEVRRGDFDESLIDVIPSSSALKEIEDISTVKVYRSLPVLKIEAAGFAVIGKLLDMFISAVNDIHDADEKKRKTLYHSAKLLEVLPARFLDSGQLPVQSLYDRIMKVCEFVCGMTDSYAVSMYRKLTGIDIV